MTRCDTCRSTQGPFDRTVLAFNNGKVKRVLTICESSTPDKRRACLARRAVLDEDGVLMGER